MNRQLIYGPAQKMIEIDHGDEMKEIIINSYVFGTPGASTEINDFNDRFSERIYSVWKRLEKELFDAGLIPHIETPVVLNAS